MLKIFVPFTLLELSQYLPFKFHYAQGISTKENPKISIEIDYLGARLAQRPPLSSGSWHPCSVGKYSICGESL